MDTGPEIYRKLGTLPIDPTKYLGMSREKMAIRCFKWLT